MTDFYIRKLAFSGPYAKTVEYTFERGINIIHGNSDKGKSYVTDCLNFMFGAKSVRLDGRSGYNTIRLYIDTSQGDICLERRLDVSRKKSVVINSGDERFKGLNGQGLGSDALEHFWLRLLGINEHQTVVTTSFYEHKLLTWNDVKRLFLLTEDDISSKSSVIRSQMKCRSALLFLLTGEAFANEETRESDNARRNRSKAAQELFDKIWKHYEERQNELLMKLSHTPVEQIRQEWSDLMERFQMEEGKLNNAIEQSHSLHMELDEARKTLSSLKMQLENYALLKTLYNARIKRQSFTTEGQLLSAAQENECACPFCGSICQEQKVVPETLSASVAEMNLTESKIRQLQDANQDLDKDIRRQASVVRNLESKCSDLDHLIASSYAPTVQEMRIQLKEYTDLLELQKELDVVSVEMNTLETKFGKKKEDALPEYEKYNPRDKFPAEFFTDMSVLLKEMLRACGEDVRSTGFDRGTFDLYVMSQDKKTYGEGYRALYNSSVAFCLFRLLCEKGMYVPGLMILDSPTKALKVSVGDSHIIGFYSWLIQNSGCGQVFVIDNELPQGLDLQNAVVYDMNDGLLPDYHRPTKNRTEDTEETNVIPGQVGMDGIPAEET